MNTTIDENKYTGVGLGNFDGLHIGHMELIDTLVSECKRLNLQSVVYTFDNHPDDVIKGARTSIILPKEQKMAMLESRNVDVLCFEKFDENYCHISAEEFVEEILVKKLKAKLVVVGFNYRFGYMGKGDTKLLKDMGKEFDFEVLVIDPIEVNDEVVSSTAIRENIVKGDIEKVNSFLGRHYSVEGVVVKGKMLGQRELFRTANIRVDNTEENVLYPAFGVYVTRTIVDDRVYNSITNIGMNPTIGDEKDVVVETHIFNFGNEIYGDKIVVEFYNRIRPEIKFSNVEELKSQIEMDIDYTDIYFKHLEV